MIFLQDTDEPNGQFGDTDGRVIRTEKAILVNNVSIESIAIHHSKYMSVIFFGTKDGQIGMVCGIGISN